MASSANIRTRAKQLKGQSVCVTLHDGRSFVGWISGLDQNGLILSVPPRGKRKPKKKASARRKKAQVSAFMPFLGGGFPGGPGPGAGAAGGPAGGLGYGGSPGGSYGFGGNPGRPGAYGFGPIPGRPGTAQFGSGTGGSGGPQNPGSDSPERPRRPGIIKTVQKYMPLMKMGYNAIKSIIPLFNGIKALMV